MKERDQWEKAIRSKLKDFEAETEPEDWRAIAKRLPEAKRTVIPLHVRRYAAAIIALLVIASGGYFYYRHRTDTLLSAGIPAEKTDRPITAPRTTTAPAATTGQSSRPAIADATPAPRTKPAAAAPPAAKTLEPEPPFTQPNLPDQPTLTDEPEDASPAQKTTDEPAGAPVQLPEEKENRRLMADAKPVVSKQKRWGIGVGGGSYSVGSNGSAPMGLFAHNRDMVYNAESVSAFRKQEEKQDISHKYPLSFGLGAGYALNDRWTVQSGLTYTMLTSEWTTLAKYLGKSKQQLHFIGIPLGMSYKIAEWNRFHFYASTGVMTEWNVGGQIRTHYYSNGEKVESQKKSLRMDEWQWSVNTRAGVSYPLIRYVNAYVEGGAYYYFDNESSIETIRSDKPFHVSLQAGIRLGF
ncbi:MAG: PorT family protein [Tannerella sp.]|jgi:hypothetical protein|nr:PorT family protein [Tannerella sp.]